MDERNERDGQDVPTSLLTEEEWTRLMIAKHAAQAGEPSVSQEKKEELWLKLSDAQAQGRPRGQPVRRTRLWSAVAASALAASAAFFYVNPRDGGDGDPALDPAGGVRMRGSGHDSAQVTLEGKSEGDVLRFSLRGDGELFVVLLAAKSGGTVDALRPLLSAPLRLSEGLPGILAADLGPQAVTVCALAADSEGGVRALADMAAELWEALPSEACLVHDAGALTRR